MGKNATDGHWTCGSGSCIAIYPREAFSRKLLSPDVQGEGECWLNKKTQFFDKLFLKEWYIPDHLHFLNGNTRKSSNASRVAEEYLDKQKQSLLMLGQQVMIYLWQLGIFHMLMFAWCLIFS